MDLQVLQAGEALATGGTAVWLLIGVRADVDEHLVPAPGRARSTAQLAGQLSPYAPSLLSALALPHLALKPRP